MIGEDQQNKAGLQRIIAGLRQLSPQFDCIRLSVAGNSMHPMYVEGDTLVIGFIQPNELRCGDVVVRGNSELITHRIVAIRDQIIYTKGDARYWIDPLSERDDILGKVIKVERNGNSADMKSRRWQLINCLLGRVSWIHVHLFWQEQSTGKTRSDNLWLHRVIYWFSKRLNWIILFLLDRKWLFHRS